MCCLGQTQKATDWVILRGRNSSSSSSAESVAISSLYRRRLSSTANIVFSSAIVVHSARYFCNFSLAVIPQKRCPSHPFDRQPSRNCQPDCGSCPQRLAALLKGGAYTLTDHCRFVTELHPGQYNISLEGMYISTTPRSKLFRHRLQHSISSHIDKCV